VSASALRGKSQDVVMVVSCRQISSAEAKPEIINKNMSFRPAFDSPLEDARDRPLVVIYGWLAAKAKHAYKYGDFYLGKGFDVLHMKILPTQMLWPNAGQKAIEELLNFTLRPAHKDQPILIHGFSVGGYLYGETLVKILNDSRYRVCGERIVGQIFDSPVDFEGVPRGTGMALSNIPAVQKSIKLSLEFYLSMFKNATVKHYLKSSEAFHNNDLLIPSLLLHSKSDPIGIPESIETVKAKWVKRNVPVYQKCWDKSPHVCHFYHHPIEYIQTLNMFLHEIGLAKEEGNTEKQALRM